MASIENIKTSISHRVQALPSLSRRTQLLIPIILGVLIPVGLRCRKDYQAWLAMGPGGLPYNVFGWTIAWAMSILGSSNLTSTSCYEDPKNIAKYAGSGNTSFLEGKLPARAGSRPLVGHWMAPHRQLEAASSQEIRELQTAQFHSLAQSNPQIVHISTSKLENRGPAIFLLPTVTPPSWSGRAGRESLHTHFDAEGSSHVLLSLLDAKEVIEKGWGERHRLSGVALPVVYVLIYAPRSKDEVEVNGQILEAGLRCMAGGVEVNS